MTEKLITLFTIIAFFTFVFIKLHIKYAKYFNLVDNSNVFNFQNFNTPTSGGINFCFSYLLFLLFLYNFEELNIDFPNRFFQINLCILGIVLLSFLDDMKNIHPGIRFPIQLLMVALSLPMITIPEIIIPYKLLFIILIIYWLYVVNIINFIDGIDAFLSTYSLFFFLSSLVYGIVVAESLFLKLLSIFFITILFIFLFFNKPKAKIFMGDTGSVFLGYFIGFVSIVIFVNGRYDLFITIMAYPIMDCSITLIKKILKKKYPWERLFDYYFLKPVVIYKKSHSYVLLPFVIYNIINIILFSLQVFYEFYFLCVVSILLTLILLCYYDKKIQKS